MTQIQSDRLSFLVPPGFKDETTYSFERHAPDGRVSESLFVLDNDAPPGSPAEFLIAERRQQMESLLGRPLTIIRDAQTDLAGLPAHSLDFVYRADGVDNYEQWIVAPNGDRAIWIVYKVPVHDKSALNVFAHIVQSASFNEEHTVLSASPGFVIRRADALTLCVPDRLRPRDVYSFISHDGRIEFTVRIFSEPQARKALSFEGEIALDDDYGATVEEKCTKAISVAGQPGKEVSYVVSRKNPWRSAQHVVHQASIDWEDGSQVRITGKAPLDARTELEQAWMDLIAAIKTR